MTGLRQYLLTLLCAAAICSILPHFSGKTGKRILRLVCGVFLTVTMIAPILRVDLELIWEAIPSQRISEDISIQGQIQARESMASIIKSETEAYILDKAKQLGLMLSATVLLSQDDIPIPVGAVLDGAATKEQKNRIAEILARDLGIPKEALQWTSD